MIYDCHLIVVFQIPQDEHKIIFYQNKAFTKGSYSKLLNITPLTKYASLGNKSGDSPPY